LDINVYKNGELNDNKYEINKLKDGFNINKKEYSLTLDCGYETKYEDYYYFTDMTQEYIFIRSSYDI